MPVCWKTCVPLIQTVTEPSDSPGVLSRTSSRGSAGGLCRLAASPGRDGTLTSRRHGECPDEGAGHSSRLIVRSRPTRPGPNWNRVCGSLRGHWSNTSTTRDGQQTATVELHLYGASSAERVEDL